MSRQREGGPPLPSLFQLRHFVPIPSTHTLCLVAEDPKAEELDEMAERVDEAIRESDTMVVRSLGPDEWDEAPGEVHEAGQ